MSARPVATARGVLPRIDPRARLLLVLAATVVALAVGLRGQLVLLGAALVLAWPLFATTRGVRRVTLLAGAGFVLGFLVNFFFWSDPVGGAFSSPARLERALALGTRMTNLALFALALAASTPHETLAEALGALVAPSARVLGARVHTGLFQLRLTLSFVPVLIAEGRRILLSQQLRGLAFAGAPWKRWWTLRPLFTPVLVFALLRAHRMSEVLIARGYRPGLARRYLVAHAWRPRDSAALLAGLAWVALAAVL